MARGPWAHRPHRPTPYGITQRPTWPATSLIHMICKVAPPGVITTLDPCRFDPRVDVELPRIARSTVIHLEDQNRPPNRLTSWETNLPVMQPPSRGHPSPLDGEVVQWTVDRPWPTSADAPPPHLHLQVPPCPLHTIKGAVVLGGDHHSSIPSSPKAPEW